MFSLSSKTFMGLLWLCKDKVMQLEKKESLREKFKPCLFPHPHTPSLFEVGMNVKAKPLTHIVNQWDNFQAPLVSFTIHMQLHSRTFISCSFSHIPLQCRNRWGKGKRNRFTNHYKNMKSLHVNLIDLHVMISYFYVFRECKFTMYISISCNNK